MPTKSKKTRIYPLLSTKRAADLLLPYANTEAEWYLTVAQLVSRESDVLIVELVVWQMGRELGRWPLHAMAYGSLVSHLAHQPEGPFAIPHAQDYSYDEYVEVGNRVMKAKQALAELAPPYNALLHRLSQTARAAGLPAAQASNWLQQAEQTLYATKGLVLKRLIREVGPPRYATHSSFLPELLTVVLRGTHLLKEFLTHSPPPTSQPGSREPTTVGAETSKWDWAQLPFLTTEMYDYLPEVELEVVEYPIRLASSRQKPALTPVATPLLADLEQPSENGVCAQLLEIRQRVDDLLASLD